MLQESDEVIVEIGLDAIVLAEDFEFTKEVDAQELHTKTGQTRMAVASQSYDASFKTKDRIDPETLMQTNGAPQPRTITITGIKQPEILRFKNALVTHAARELGEQEIELIAEDLEAETLW